MLASVLLESYPPQAGGATFALTGLDLDDLVGLTSTVDQAGTTPVVWSDYPVTVGGVIQEGTLQVRSVPRAVSAKVDGLRVRFSPVSEPVKSGDTVWWAFDVTNEGSTSDTITFGSGQRAEVVLTQGGVEKYRWSAGKSFTQAVEEVTVQSGKTWSVAMNDTLSLAPGVYDMTANITASHAPRFSGSGGAGSLPQLSTTLTVY
jgi:plastocyanin